MSVAYVKGGRDREIRIELDPERMQAFGVTLDQVRTLITAGNVSAPLGTQVQEGQNRKVVLDGFLTSDDDLKHLIVGANAGRPIYLGDVAHIVDAHLKRGTRSPVSLTAPRMRTLEKRSNLKYLQ